MVEIKFLEKSFGRLKVLRGVDLIIRKGSLTAILGPNASGKTTIIKSILGLVIPDKGEIIVDGIPVRRNWNYRNTIGYMPQIARFPENLTIRELISMLKDIRGSNGSADGLLDLFELQPALNQSLRNLSGGTRQKVNAVMALMFDAPLLIMDEPTSGLDPVSLIKLKEYIVKERENGKTILLTTHIMGLVEELADEIVFLLEGKIYFQGSVQQLLSRYREERVERAIAKMMEQNLLNKD
ncbi:MAG TPA: ABC transporter ATP-binding protein [Chitinophagales bacterium]|nr:ABC transporter ATP-binding protein [Chitinophagales bacterium]